jgi:Tol biopolymer transport system component/imidazolonepropionase-like amidohydrolase
VKPMTGRCVLPNLRVLRALRILRILCALSPSVLCVLCSFLCVLVADTAQDVTARGVVLTEGTSMSAAVSPDRRWIAIDLVGALWILPMRGGEAKRITPEVLEARQPTWSPDSESLAFQGYGDDGVWHIYVLPRAGGEARAITAGEFDDREPAWSHDGARIAFSSDRYGGIVTIWELTLATGELRRVSGRDGVMPAWSPSDREITFVSRDRERTGPADNRRGTPGVWGVNAEGAERLIVAAPRGGPDDGPVAAGWNPDGTEFAYVTARGRLFVGSRQVSANDEDVFPFRPQWISRTEFVYTADGHVKRRSVSGVVTAIPFGGTVTLRRAAYTIAHRPLEVSEPQMVRGIVTPVVSPNGRYVAFTALGDLWVLPLGGAPAQITNDAAVDLDPAWSPDATQIAFASDRGGHMNIWIHDLASNTDRQLTRTTGGADLAPVWSPDGSTIVYLSGRGMGVATVQASRDCRVTVAAPPTTLEVGRPTISPDCKSIALGALLPYSDRYREGLNQLLVWSADLHSWSSSILLPRHNAGNRQDTGPVWSPDGSVMAFVSEGKLLTVPVDNSGGVTGPLREVATDQPESPSFEGDSRHIVYQTPGGLRRIVSEGSPPEAIPLDMRWRPAEPPARVVVHAGHVIDNLSDGVRGESDIVVERGVIRSVGPHDDALHVGSVVNASDEFVMPGLIEMHAHLDSSYGGRFGRLWLAFGITSLRIPAVNPYAGIEQREAFDVGRRPGPRVFLAGDPFDGVRSYYPGGVAITSDAVLDQELDRAAALGVDFFKTYVRLPDRFQQRVIDFAHARGKPVTSHELFPAVAFGIDGIEHLTGTSRRGYTPKQSATARAYQDVIDLIGRSGVTLTPTIGLNGGYRARLAGDRSLLFDRRLALYPLPVVAALTDLANLRPDPALDAAVKPYEVNLKAIVAAGGRIIAGTDSPIVPYGLGLHVELEAYVHAGLTPFQALQTATTNAAQALGLENELGTIEPGKIADFAFVGGDPIVDIRNTRDVRRVMKGGRVYTVDELVR